MKNNFYYPSADQVTKIHAIEWIPEREVVAVLQISHGMVEYIDRYDDFANYMAGRGYYVVGQDHLGHGESVTSEEKHGYFHKTKGNEYVLEDIHTLRKRTQKKYPQVPYFMLGHSMGSFLLRQYLHTHGEGLAGAVIMGTGSPSIVATNLGRVLCKCISTVKGDTYRSPMVDQMAFGGYNKKFEPARTKVDWLSRNKENVDKYLQDPWCTFVFTVNGYYHMLGGVKTLSKQSNLESIPKDLPVLFVSGKDDPVGNFGQGVEKVYRQYKHLGIKDVSIRLYEKDRHEILNEVDKKRVYQDIWTWLERRRDCSKTE